MHGSALLTFALDYPEPERARQVAATLGPEVDVMKVGLELFIRGGPEIVREVAKSGARVFLDLKLHDITETVERAVASVCALGVEYLTLHASGGTRMIELARQRVDREGASTRLLAVTVLTSLDAADLREVGVRDSAQAQVGRLALLAKQAGAHGVVCSAEELRQVRALTGSHFLLCTPGIRPLGADPADQKRVATPASAVQDGADLLVVGRPIRDAADPVQAARAIREEMRAAVRSSDGA